jgi:hypothetical protein
VATADRAQENMNYVRALLKTNQPEFAVLLERIEREWSCPGRGGPCCLLVAGYEAFLETAGLLLERAGVTVTGAPAQP